MYDETPAGQRHVFTHRYGCSLESDVSFCGKFIYHMRSSVAKRTESQNKQYVIVVLLCECLVIRDKLFNLSDSFT